MASSESHQSFKCDFKDLTEIVFISSYESRLIQDEEVLGDPVCWWTRCGDEYSYIIGDCTPISAGSRLISPEEIYPLLDVSLKIDCDGHLLEEEENEDKDETGETHEQNPDEEHVSVADECFSNPWTLFSGEPHQSVDELPREQIFRDYQETDGNPSTYRERCATTRSNIRKEVRELCDQNGIDMDDGLLVALNDCWFPLGIMRWLKEQFYCGCFSITGIMSMEYIHNDKHKVLVCTVDGESG